MPFAYAAKAATTTTTDEPDIDDSSVPFVPWPPNFPWPPTSIDTGPWPPGWPQHVDGDGYTLDASISATVVTCTTLKAAANTDELAGQRIAVFATLDGNAVQIKNLPGDSFSDILFFPVTNYAGAAYGFQKAIIPDIDAGDVGDDVVITCQVVGLAPVVSDTVTVTLAATAVGTVNVNVTSDPTVDGEQKFANDPHNVVGLYYAAWVSGAWRPGPALDWNTRIDIVQGAFVAVGTYTVRMGSVGYANEAAALAASVGLVSTPFHHDGSNDIGVYIPDSGWGDNSKGADNYVIQLNRLW